jgi:hypothetical protein
MRIPENTKLPFFAYGLFKPGQLCFYRIKDLVESTSTTEIGGYLKERDGIPLLIPSENAMQIKGVLIHFKEGLDQQAYERIIEIEPDEVYRWESAPVSGGIIANVLLGKRPDRGSTDLEHVEEWDGRKDPYFLDAIGVIEDIMKDNPEFKWDNYKPLLRLQMAYSLLWTCLERYAGLRYHLGKDVDKKVLKIAKDAGFASGLKKYVKHTREVYSTTDLKMYTLDSDSPEKSLKYYYQIRCNSIHRGKAVVRDYDTMRYSLEELLNIFKDMLNEAWDAAQS